MKEIILDEIYNFEKPKGYLPMGFITVEDEIKDICNKNKILVQNIVKFDGYKVYGKKVRNRKTYGKANLVLEKSPLPTLIKNK